MKQNILFIGLVLIIVNILFWGIFIRGEKEFSIIENRELSSCPNFSFKDFNNGDFQNNYEKFLQDQILLGKIFKNSYINIKNFSFNLISNIWTSKEGILKKDKGSIDISFQSNDISEVLEIFEKKSCISKPYFYNEIKSEELFQTSFQDFTLIEESKRKARLEKTIFAEISDTNKVKKIIQYKKKYMDKIKGINITKADFEVEWIPRGNRIIELVDENHLVFSKVPLEKATPLLTRKAKDINLLADKYKDINFYTFYIETDIDFDMANGKITHDLYKYFSSQLEPLVNSYVLSIEKLQDYIDCFYKTDHHWDTEGQIKGYNMLISSIFGEEEPLVSFDTYYTDLKYNGYKSRRLNDFQIYDPFKFIIADIIPYKTYINGKENTYGQKENYLKGIFDESEGVSHYTVCNGYDFGLIEYDFNQPLKDNVIIFVDSFSNPINPAIASHYNKTYFVDLRHYEKSNGKFVFEEFIKNKDISSVIHCGYYYLYAMEEFVIGE